MSNKDIDSALNKIYPDTTYKSNDYMLPQNKIFDNSYKVVDKPVKKDKSWIYILIGLILLLFLIVVIVLCYGFFSTGTSDTSTTETNDENANIGAMLSSSEYYNATINFNRKLFQGAQIILEPDEIDNCEYGYYTGNSDQVNSGNLDDCHFQAHSYSYFNVGKFPMTYIKNNIGRHDLSLNYDVNTGMKSRNSATSICDNTDGCIGVEYNHSTNEASLIMSNVIGTYPDLTNNTLVIKLPELDFSDERQVYLNKKNKPHFNNAVFGYSSSLPLRYYMAHDNQSTTVNNNFNIKKKIPGVVIFPNNVQRILEIVPQRIINYGGLIGRYYDDTDKLIYTDTNTDEYNLPLDLQKYTKLYITYTSS